MSAIINDIEKYITDIREQKVKATAKAAEAAAKAGDAAKAGEPGERYTDIVKILEKCETKLTTHKDTLDKRLAGEDLNELLKVEANKVLFYKKLNEYTNEEFQKLPESQPNPLDTNISDLPGLNQAIKSDYDAFIESLGKFVS
jgi:hypothetical protein